MNKPASFRVCAKCGAEFEYVAKPGYGRRKYCSKKCRNLSRGKNRVCRQCGKSYRGDGPYCSRKCSAEGKHLRGKMRKCATCGALFRPDVGASLSFCSPECKPKQPEKCANCGGPMPDMRPYQAMPDVYCSCECKAAALRARDAVKRKAQLEVSNKKKRYDLSRALRMWRRGVSLREIGTQIGWKESGVPSRLRQSYGYRIKTANRMHNSKWHEVEATRNARSMKFRRESDFLAHAVLEFKARFDSVEPEVAVPGTRRRIDLVVTDGLFRFGVELKNGNRTARLDQTLGQAIVKCAALGGLKPVCVVPDDVRPDKVFLHGCEAAGAIAGRLSDVVERMRLMCCK